MRTTIVSSFEAWTKVQPYTANGHCPQRGDLPVYLPANGALLAAVAMMAGGWDDAPSRDAPGFPKDGT